MPRQSWRAVVMLHLLEAGRRDVIAPSIQIEEASMRSSEKPSWLFPLGFEENSTPRGFNVWNSSSRTLGNSWLGTWNSEAFAKMPSNRLSGNIIAKKS